MRNDPVVIHFSHFGFSHPAVVGLRGPCGPRTAGIPVRHVDGRIGPGSLDFFATLARPAQASMRNTDDGFRLEGQLTFDMPGGLGTRFAALLGVVVEGGTAARRDDGIRVSGADGAVVLVSGGSSLGDPDHGTSRRGDGPGISRCARLARAPHPESMGEYSAPSNVKAGSGATCGAWLCWHIWKHYDSTRDLGFFCENTCRS